MQEKEIIIILWWGWMMWIFTAWVLNSINKKYRNRVHSVYWTSSWADVWVYFVSNQTEVPYNFFLNHLTKKDFIRKNIFSYIFKIFFIKNKINSKIKDYINIDFVVKTAEEWDYKLDLEKFNNSKINFFVKLINIKNWETIYVDAKNDLFKKLNATSNCWPLSSKAIEIDGDFYIDWETFVSWIDEDLVSKFKNKKIIYIESSYRSFFEKIILYPLHLLASFAIKKLYWKVCWKLYIKRLFLEHSYFVKNNKNVIHLKNNMNYSAFCTNKKILRKIYKHWLDVWNNVKL